MHGAIDNSRLRLQPPAKLFIVRRKRLKFCLDAIAKRDVHGIPEVLVETVAIAAQYGDSDEASAEFSVSLH
jgi:hypothetical protein